MAEIKWHRGQTLTLMTASPDSVVTFTLDGRQYRQRIGASPRAHEQHRQVTAGDVLTIAKDSKTTDFLAEISPCGCRILLHPA